MNERNEFQVGEVVDITIKGARIERVQDEGHDGDVTRVAGIVAHDGDGAPFFTAVPLDWTTVLVERRAPIEWPPQIGDLWRDAEGILWFAVHCSHDGDDFTELRCQDSSRGSWTLADPDEVLRRYGPMVLAHREDGAL